MEKKLDVIEIFMMLKKEFPHVEFLIFEEDKQIGLHYYRFYKFELVKLFNQKFEKPIKTSISFLSNNEYNFEDYNIILNKMKESFSIKKLIGLE